MHLKITKGIKLGNLSLHSLLHADDLAILAGNILTCKKLENLHDWCARWGIQVNSNESAIINFRPKTLRTQALHTELKVRNQSFQFFFKEYKYLGIILDEFLSFQQALLLRTDQANKAFWSLCSQQMKLGEVPAQVYRKLYDSMVAPLFHYGAPVWSHYCSTANLDKVQNRAYRLFLGRCKSHRSLLAWLTGGKDLLEIETGSYVGTPPDQRFCKL